MGLAEQADGYEKMSQQMESVAKTGDELSVEERNLLSVAYKNAVGSRRAAWRIISSVQQKETTKGNADNAGYAKEYCAKVETELQGICDTILALLEKKLIPKAEGGESKVFYQKMMADYYRYIAEFTEGDAKSKAAESARKAYADAAAVAEKDLAVTHPIRLGLALNYSVFQYEVLQQPDEACKMARTASRMPSRSLTMLPRNRTRTPRLSCSCSGTTSHFGHLIRKGTSECKTNL